jgi:hypothetical protein
MLRKFIRRPAEFISGEKASWIIRMKRQARLQPPRAADFAHRIFHKGSVQKAGTRSGDFVSETRNRTLRKYVKACWKNSGFGTGFGG